MLDDLVDSSDLKNLEMLYPNSQRQRNPTFNLEDKPVDIETDLENFSNISQQIKRALKAEDDIVFQPSHDNLSIEQEEYRKRRKVKDSKAQEERQDGKIKQVRGDRMFEIKSPSCTSVVNKTNIQEELPPDSPEARYLEKGSDQDDNDIRLPPVRVGKGPKTAAANGKPVGSKLSSASTKLVRDELLPGSLEARSLKDNNDQDDDDVKLLPVRAGKGPRIATANGKPASAKLSLTSIKLVLGIRQDVRAKKILTLKTN